MNGKTIFITGASSGFGAACARMFATEDNRLILTARRIEPLLKLQEELAAHAEVHIIPLDVRDREAVQGAIDGLPERFRAIERVFEAWRDFYGWTLRRVVRHRIFTIGVLAATLVATVYLYTRVPTGFIPSQDTGFIAAWRQLLRSRFGKGAAVAWTFIRNKR